MENLTYQDIAAMLSGVDVNAVYKDIKKWEDAELKGDTAKIKALDFSVTPVCFRCSRPCMDPMTKEYKPMKCGRCQAVIYCSRPCQVADWKTPKEPRAPTHKELCPKNKEHMERLPYFQSVFNQFPWARTESDGTCSHPHLQARFGVLGSDLSVGYWCSPCRYTPHDEPRKANAKPKKAAKPYQHGAVLLGNKWPSDIEAWCLKNPKLIPRLYFSDENQAPEKPQPGQVKDWTSWYAWRGLSLDSPAALMMDYPLSVYHLLVDVLKVVDLGRSAGNKKTLVVHYLGAEVELNFLPLFSELALLLPNMHIEFVIFGKAGRELVLKAQKSHPGSLATHDPIWSYTAPKKTGGGSIDIRIHESDTWTQSSVTGGEPSVLVGMNSGLFSYPDWMEVIFASSILEIPFGVTEYAEQSMETFATGIPGMLSRQAMGGAPPMYAKALMKKRTYPIRVNPFHRVGQRNLPVIRMPNNYNGFSMPVVWRES